MLRSVALALITAVSAGPAPAGARAGSLVALVAAGERSWTTSPDPRAPVACVTCHYDPDETRGWESGRASWRERVCIAGGAVPLAKKTIGGGSVSTGGGRQID